MNTALWIIAGLLATVFLVAGSNKLFIPREKLARAPGGGWVLDFSAGFVKALGAVEILGAVGLILPALLDIAPVLVPLAATGLATIVVGAAIVTYRRQEFKHVMLNPDLSRPDRLRGVGALRSRVLHWLTGCGGFWTPSPSHPNNKGPPGSARSWPPARSRSPGPRRTTGRSSPRRPPTRPRSPAWAVLRNPGLPASLGTDCLDFADAAGAPSQNNGRG